MLRLGACPPQVRARPIQNIKWVRTNLRSRGPAITVQEESALLFEWTSGGGSGLLVYGKPHREKLTILV